MNSGLTSMPSLSLVSELMTCVHISRSNIIIIKYHIYIAPYSQSALWRCALFVELFKKIFISFDKIRYKLTLKK